MNTTPRRLLPLAAACLLAACSGDPRALGITGPGASAAPPPPPQEQGESAPLGAPQVGTPYGISIAPTTGTSGFWGYNQ